jgi:DNA polymerase-1
VSTIDKVAGPFTRIGYEDINLDAHGQVKKYLLANGWKPTTWNYKKDPKTKRLLRDAGGHLIKTSPKLTEDSFHTIEGDFGKLYARRNIITHRRRTIRNYDDPENKGILAYIREDGRVPAEGITCATPTARTTHTRACCNVPKASKKVVYGREMRSLFCTKAPWVMLGADLDQIEARITAHYAWKFDGGSYAENVLEGDLHQRNADSLGVSRDLAKGIQYALYYGARAPKIASMLKCSNKEAEARIDAFWGNSRGVQQTIEYLARYYKKNRFIRGLDGRKLMIRAEYKLLNSLIQSAAAIVFKRWGVIANERLRDAGLECYQVIAYHDEYDYRCHPLVAYRAIKIIQQAAIDAGLYYNMKVPITTGVIVGHNWAEIH